MTTGRPDSFLDGFSNGFRIVDEVPADLNTKNKVKDHLQDHSQNTNGPFPRLTIVYDSNQPNFKSPTSLQTGTSKEGLEALQHSTLVMFESKTSTGSEETQSSKKSMQEYRTSSKLQSFQTMFLELEHPALQKGNPVAPALHGTGMSMERQDIASSSQSSSGVTQPYIPAMTYPIRRENQQQRRHCAKNPACPMCPVCSNIKQCVYVSDVNSVETVEGVLF